MGIRTKSKKNSAIAISVLSEMTSLKALQDYKKIIAAIIEQSMDEYVKLQHPKYRKKKTNYESFSTAIDIFFLNDYKFLYFVQHDGSYMNTKDLLSLILNSANPDLNTMRDHLIQTAYTYWESKYMKTINIPDCFCFKGHVYIVQHTKNKPYVDHKDKTINMDRKQTLENEKIFLNLSLEIVNFLFPDLTLSETFYEILKMNQIQINY